MGMSKLWGDIAGITQETLPKIEIIDGDKVNPIEMAVSILKIILLLIYITYSFAVGLGGASLQVDAISLAHYGTGIAGNSNISINPASIMYDSSNRLSFSYNRWFNDVKGNMIMHEWQNQYILLNTYELNDIDLLVSDIIREPVWHRSGPSYNVKEFDYIKSKLNISEKKIIQINHHLAHAASVFYTSGFNNSAILIVDGNGTDLETNSFFEGKNKKIELVDKYKASGIGSVYGMITSHCLNLGLGGEGKTMGLAPFGSKGKSVLDFSKVNLLSIDNL